MYIRLLCILSALLVQLVSLFGAVEPVSFEKVDLNDSFWKPWRDRQASVTIPAALKKTENAVENLKIAGEWNSGDRSRQPDKSLPIFVSSDLYKIMESAAYSLMVEKNPALEKRLDEIIEIIAKAQRPDGYLYMPHILEFKNPTAGKTPYSNLIHSHELYNLGHMYEAAVAYKRATGKDSFMKIAEKSARHVKKVFFDGDPNYNGGKPVNQAPGHEEIELALCLMGSETGDKFYLDLAKRFLEIRGVTYIPKGLEGLNDPSYAQQHKRVSEQREPIGHAVRALYLYTGMAASDAALGTDDYGKALESIWGDIVSSRMHITGGLGAIAAIEGFGAPFELPNRSTYNETCAAVANVFFNHEMFLRSLDAKYLDIMELSLFNGALSGISISGDRFFYENPLEADGRTNFNHGEKTRSAWMSCACCPPNISRLLMKVSGYFYAKSEDSIWVCMYASGKVDFQGEKISIRQDSDYPFGGSVKLHLKLDSPKKFSLRLRIPTWARSNDFVPGGLYSFSEKKAPLMSYKVEVNGESMEVPIEKGFAVITREWKSGDLVELELPMDLREVVSDSRVRSNEGCVALTRGPLVYCLEEADLGANVCDVYFDKIEPGGGGVFADGELKGIRYENASFVKISDGSAGKKLKSKVIPYFAWNNRGGDSMRVWLPVSADIAKKMRFGAAEKISELCDSVEISDGSPFFEALFDGLVVKKSSDIGKYQVWISRKKSEPVSVELRLNSPKTLKSASVFFIVRRNSVALPKSWKIAVSKDGKSFSDMPIYLTDSYGTFPDKFNVVHPSSPLKCSALKFIFEPQKGKKIGVSEILLELE